MEIGAGNERDRSSRIRRKLKNGIWTIGLNVLRQVLGVAAVVVLTRVLTKEQFGNYQGILAVVGICSAFTLTGLGSVIVQSVARGHEGTYRAAVRMSFIGAILGGLVILGCGIGAGCKATEFQPTLT